MSALGSTRSGDEVVVDLDRLIGSHACVVANSGGGKSGLIRRLLETTHGRIQHIVLDVEDEFYTLRERFDYVIAGGDGGDAPATAGSAAALARASLQHGFSLIVQLNDLGPDGSAEFVGRFLKSLISAPRDLWRPMLVVIDEAQRFVPRNGDTEASAGVKDLLARGRKRGLTAVLASQSLPEIDARVRGLVQNWMLGGVSTALDRKTVADALGFPPSSAEARELQGLPPRTFWAYGPALSRTPVQFRVADVETTPVHPGQAKVSTPPPPEALRAILQGLATPVAPEPAADGEKAASAPSAAALKAARDEGYAAGLEEGERRGEMRGVALGLTRARSALGALRVPEIVAREPSATETPPPVPAPRPVAVGPRPDGSGISRATQSIIATLEAAWPRALPFTTAAKHAGVGLKSSQFHRYEPELRASGRAEELDGRWRALVERPSGVSLIDAARARLSPSHARILDVLVKEAGAPLTRESIAVAADVSVTSSTTGAALSILADMDLVERTADGRFHLAEAFR